MGGREEVKDTGPSAANVCTCVSGLWYQRHKWRHLRKKRCVWLKKITRLGKVGSHSRWKEIPSSLMQKWWLGLIIILSGAQTHLKFIPVHKCISSARRTTSTFQADADESKHITCWNLDSQGLELIDQDATPGVMKGLMDGWMDRWQMDGGIQVFLRLLHHSAAGGELLVLVINCFLTVLFLVRNTSV